MSKPLALSDEELTIITNICAPLQPQERSQLLSKLAEHLRGARAEIGPGGLHRLARELLRQVWRPPASTAGPQPARRVVGEPLE
jgi:hypothetical protein